MIRKLLIRNFKCIRELEIDLAPLTIFVGPNGSGKSSILEALALMSQSSSRNVEAWSADAIKGRGPGDDEVLVEYDDLKSILHGGRESELLLGFKTSVKTEEIRRGLERDLKEFEENLRKGAVQESLAKTYLSLLHQLSLKREEVEVGYVYRADRSTDSHTYSIDGQAITLKHMRKEGRVERVSEPKDLDLSLSGGFPPGLYVAGWTAYLFDELAAALRKRLGRVYYLSSERGSVSWTYEAGEGERRWVGRRGRYTLEILAKLMSPENGERWSPYEILCERFGIRRAWAGWERRNVLTSRYRDPYLNVSFKLPSLGYGSRQLLPIMVQLAYSEPGSVILVEEPEISLHPSHQRLLPVLFGRAVNEGKQVLVTTHSSYFPLSLDLVLEGYRLEGQTTEGWRSYEVKLSASDVAVYHVTRDEREGCTKVERLELDEAGLKEGVPSFVEVERAILEKYISGK
jgi:ABC-type cobalamin/Fe3+-siderophores transport system ATPase subunit